jgi:hypothetical protein
VSNALHARIAYVLLFCGVCTGALAAQEKSEAAVSAPYAGATVSDFRGKVAVQLPGHGLMSPSRGAILPPDSVVNTEEGRMLLRLADGSNILVRPHTKLVLKQPEASGWHYLQLTLGEIHSQIQHRLGGSPSFQMGTPSAVISVRGTVFDVEVDSRGNTELDVQEGAVEFGSAEGRGDSVLVTAGFSSRVGKESGPEVPRPTHDLRPQLDRRSRHDRGSRGDDDAIRRLEASGRDSRDGDSGGGSITSGSSGGSDDGHSGSGSDSGSGSGTSGSDGGSRSGSSGSDGGSGSSGSGDGDRRNSGGGKPPGLL